MSVPVASGGNSLRVDNPRSLFQTGLSGQYPGLRTYGVSSDGDRFLISMSDDHGVAASIVVVSNWQAALKR
jgi:hypothetical protein